MSLNVTLNLPPDLEAKLREAIPDLSSDVKEAYVLELFRRGMLSHYELSTILGLDQFQTDGFLKLHNVFEGSLTMDDLEADRNAVQDALSKRP